MFFKFVKKHRLSMNKKNSVMKVAYLAIIMLELATPPE